MHFNMKTEPETENATSNPQTIKIKHKNLRHKII